MHGPECADVLGTQHALVRAAALVDSGSETVGEDGMKHLRLAVLDASMVRRNNLVVYVDYLLQSLGSTGDSGLHVDMCKTRLVEARDAYAKCMALVEQLHEGEAPKVTSDSCTRCRAHDPVFSSPQDMLGSTPTRIVLCNTSQQIAESYLKDGAEAALQNALDFVHDEDHAAGQNRTHACESESRIAKQYCAGGRPLSMLWSVWANRKPDKFDVLDMTQVQRVAKVVACVTRADCISKQRDAAKRMLDALQNLVRVQ